MKYPLSVSDGGAQMTPMGTYYCFGCGHRFAKAKNDKCPRCEGMGQCLVCREVYEMDYIRADITAYERLTAKPTRRCRKCKRYPDKTYHAKASFTEIM